MNESKFDSESKPTAETSPVPVTEKPTHTYTTIEKCLALALIGWGYAFFRLYPVYRHPKSALVLLCCLFALTLFVLHKTGHKLRGMALAGCLSAVPVCLSLALPANELIHTLAFLYGLAAFAYTVYAACGNTLENGFSDLLPIDLLKAIFFMPFSALGGLFAALRSEKNGHLCRRIFAGIGRVLGGFSLALIPTLVVLLLLSYDDKFVQEVGHVLSKLYPHENVLSHLLYLTLGFLFAIYLFGLYTAAKENRCPTLLTADGCRKTAAALHSFSPITTVSAVLPVLFLYGIFLFTQWDSYISVWGTLPDTLIYSQYAREGFFELCLVSMVNLVLLTVSGMATRKQNDRPHPALRVLHIVLSVCTLLLGTTAMAKLFLYMRVYGLTEKRVYAAWFMLVLACIFILVIVKQFCPRLRVVALAMAVCVGMFAILALSNMNERINKYNMDHGFDVTLCE